MRLALLNGAGPQPSRQRLQGYLAHEKQPPPLGPPKDLRYSPTVGSWEGVVSYERGTPVRAEDALHEEVMRHG